MSTSTESLQGGEEDVTFPRVTLRAWTEVVKIEVGNGVCNQPSTLSLTGADVALRHLAVDGNNNRKDDNYDDYERNIPLLCLFLSSLNINTVGNFGIR